MKINKACRDVEMCLPLEVFNMDYFFNKGLLITHGKEVCFYDIGKPEAQVKQEPDVVEVKESVDVEEVRKEVEEVRGEVAEVRKEVVRVRKEVTEIRRKVGKVKEEMVALKGRISDLVEASSKHTDRMAEAVSLMMMMTRWFRERFPDAPKSLSGPGSVSKSPGPGSISIPKPPQASKPLTTPSSTRPLIVKRTIPRLSETEKETPESPAKKKAKVT